MLLATTTVDYKICAVSKKAAEGNLLGIYDEAKEELTVKVTASPKENCFRLVHDGQSVLFFFENDGLTETAHNLICGTKEGCEKEFAALGYDVSLLEKKDAIEDI